MAVFSLFLRADVGWSLKNHERNWSDGYTVVRSYQLTTLGSFSASPLCCAAAFLRVSKEEQILTFEPHLP